MFFYLGVLPPDEEPPDEEPLEAFELEFEDELELELDDEFELEFDDPELDSDAPDEELELAFSSWLLFGFSQLLPLPASLLPAHSPPGPPLEEAPLELSSPELEPVSPEDEPELPFDEEFELVSDEPELDSAPEDELELAFSSWLLFGLLQLLPLPASLLPAHSPPEPPEPPDEEPELPSDEEFELEFDDEFELELDEELELELPELALPELEFSLWLLLGLSQLLPLPG